TVAGSTATSVSISVTGNSGGGTLTRTAQVPLLRGDFTLATPPTLSVLRGGSGQLTVQVQTGQNFVAQLSFTCSGLPAGASCSAASADGAPSTTAVTIRTAAASVALPRDRINPWGPWTLLLLGLVALAVGYRRCRRWALVGALAAASIACGGGGGGGGGGGSNAPPPVTSTVTVTATDTTPGVVNPVSHSTTFQLTVQ